MDLYGSQQDADDVIVIAWAGKRECQGFVTTRKLNVGDKQVRGATGGDCPVRNGYDFKFAGHDQTYTVTKERDYDRKTDTGMWDFEPPAVAEIKSGAAITFSRRSALGDGFWEELTPEEWQQVKGMTHPLSGPNRWKRVGGVITEIPDGRKPADFFNGKPVAMWDDRTKTLKVPLGEPAVSVEMHAFGDDGLLDTGFTRRIEVELSGVLIVVDFVSGKATLQMDTSMVGLFELGASPLFKIAIPLRIAVYEVNKVSTRR